MSDYHVFLVTNSGVPTASLTPTWSTLKQVVDGVDYTPQPAITEIGGGWYKYELNLADFGNVVGVIDAGVTITAASERYIKQEIRWSQPDQDEKKEIVLTTTYDEDTLTLTFLTALQVNGKQITTGITAASISVYDEGHTLQFTVSSTSFTNGVAVISKSSPTLTKNKSYYALVTLTTTLGSYRSAESYLVLE